MYITLPVITVLMVLPGLNDRSKAFGSLLKGFLWSGGDLDGRHNDVCAGIGQRPDGAAEFPDADACQGDQRGPGPHAPGIRRVGRLAHHAALRSTSLFYTPALSGWRSSSGSKSIKESFYRCVSFYPYIVGRRLSEHDLPDELGQYTYTPWIITLDFFIPLIMVFVYIVKKTCVQTDVTDTAVIKE